MPAAPDLGRLHALRRRPLSAWLAAAGAAVIAFSAARAVIDGFVPMDDNAVTEVRARDVLGGPFPLLGSVSSASLDGGTVHHPGPLLFDLLSVPTHVFPDGAGVAVGAATINIVCVVVAVWSARRALGEHGAVVVAAAAAALMWALGSEALFDPWQPVVTLLPFLLALVAGWAWGCGHDGAAPVVVLAISFVVQSHGSYLLVAPAVLVAAGAARLLCEAPVRRRPLVLAVAFGVLAWLQPLADQFGGSGNLGTILGRAAGGGDDSTLGLSAAIRAAATVLVVPPWWLRSGVATSLPIEPPLDDGAGGARIDPDWIALPLAIAAIVALLVALVLAIAVARRRRDHALASGGAIAVVAVVAAVVTLAGLPIDAFGFSVHKARWLWPLGVFISGYLTIALIRLDVVPSRRHAATSVALLGAVGLVATLPASFQWLSPQQFLHSQRHVAAELRAAAGVLEGRGVVLLDLRGRPFPDPYNDTLAAELVRRGVDVRVVGDYTVGHYGEARRLDDAGADITLRVLVGDDIDDPPGHYTVVAVVEADGARAAIAVAAGNAVDAATA